MALASSTRLGPYEIIAQLGAGGMGEVYRARDTRLEREVAIKVLPEAVARDPVALARFQREVKAVAALPHPNILAIYDVGTDQETTYAVMELLEGETLAGRLKQGPLDWRAGLTIATGVADGLAAAHAKGVIHRDIKPGNLFLTAEGGVKILDFGLARIDSKATTPPALMETVTLETRPGVLIGTVAYMAPEQLRGQSADARSDLFAFGCVLYEMMTGRRPFLEPTNADTMAAILHEAPPPLSASGRERPAELDRVILRCLEKDPTRRFQSARDLAVALRSIGREAAQVDTKHPLRTAPHQAPEAPKPAQGAAASVAVLPFVNMSSDRENEYFSDGLAEELIIALSKIDGLHVASRTSAFAFKGKNDDVRKIGEQLNVRTVLEGSVRKAGQRLRIFAQLVSVADGYHLWSETYNRQLEDVFAIQDEIAQHIAKALRVLLTEKGKKALERVPTADVEAYDYYLRGRQFFHQFRRKGFEFARQMFARAIEQDPGYALAFAGMADCHSLLYTYWETTEAHLQQADASSRKALQLAPDLAEGRVARGLAVSLRKQFAEAEGEFETAIRLDASLFAARYFYGRTCLAEGKLEKAAELFEQACRLRPDDYQPACHLSSIYAGLGRKDDARAASSRCLEVVEKHLALHPEDARALYLGAVVWCQVGQAARGLDWAARALALDPEEPVTFYNVACVYALQGKIEPAIECLERAVQHGFAHKEWIEHDADLNALHAQPRYQTLLSKLSGPGAWKAE
jgi:serine/threonine protein kinase/tetratricopeptide (TPR) repeat protein